MLEQRKNGRGIIELADTEIRCRRSTGPVALFKPVLLQHLDGNALRRGTLRRPQTDIAYRWFLRYRRSEELTHFSTVSYNLRHWYAPETIRAVFRWITDGAGNAGALSPAAALIDGTHIKAGANLKKNSTQDVSVTAKRYQEELPAEVNADREVHGKMPLDDGNKPPEPGGKKGQRLKNEAGPKEERSQKSRKQSQCPPQIWSVECSTRGSINSASPVRSIPPVSRTVTHWKQ